MDKDYPLTCATFGNYFLPRQQLGTVESLARKAIEFTDVNAIASDGWFLLARKEHYEGDTGSSKVVSFYEKADMARGDDAKGYLPAKFGAAQAQVRNGDYEGAKFRLDNMSKQHSNLEVKVLLGCLYAQEVFDNQASGFKEDKSEELKRAISYLDTVRVSWKDPKRASSPDMNLLIILSRLYEIEQPEKSLQCLLQVQSMSLANLAEEYQYLDEQDDESRREKSKAHLPAQLLNNIGCFQYQMEKFEEAASNFQIGLNACMIIEKSNKVKEENDNSVSDQLVTTISFNLARSYEASGLFDEAKTVYEGLLNRHAEYTDARVRLAYIKIRQDPQREGPKTMASLFESESRNMEVRALYGWYLSKSKKRTMVVAEDQEQRHYKQTLQQFDKHDQYSLTGMGNIHLTVAREMKRESEQDKDKRRGTYQRSIEFYHKALQLDPRNAYAAQGIGIALAEDKKDFGAAVQVFSKVKDTVKDASVLVNLGHIYAELKQFSKAIENVSDSCHFSCPDD
jgi:RNA polymerase-associated protein CTR9